MKKTKNNMKKNKNKKLNQENINLDNEIVIGLTPKREDNIKTKSKKKKKNIKKQNKSNPKKSANEKQKRKSKFGLKIIKWTCLIIFLILLIVLFLRSSIFNIKEIIVENNSKVTTEEIAKLSTLEVGMNMFKYSNSTIENLIKGNAYIENVKIKKSITGVITLNITERKPTYMLKFANAYVYINNQGYMLELTETPIELPIIIGFETPGEQIKEGNRLAISDLEKLEDVIKIVNSASETPISKLITTIDITDKTDYKLELASENKIVRFGGATNINVKLLKIQEVLEKEKGIAGEIYFQDSERTIFKENV